MQEYTLYIKNQPMIKDFLVATVLLVFSFIIDFNYNLKVNFYLFVIWLHLH